MKAIVYEDYGPPEVLKLQDVVKPEPGEGEILVRVRAAAVSTADSAFRKGDRFSTRLASGLRRPRKRVLGTELAGDIEAVGTVSRTSVGRRGLRRDGSRIRRPWRVRVPA